MKFCVLTGTGDIYDAELDSVALFREHPALTERLLNLIDTRFHFRDSEIVIRKNIIVLKIYYLRCLLTIDRLYVSKDLEKHVPQDAVHTVVQYVIYAIKQRGDTRRFPIIAMESVFTHVRDHFDRKIIHETSREVVRYQTIVNDTSVGHGELFAKSFVDFYNNLSTLRAKIGDITDLFKEFDEMDDDDVAKFVLDYEKSDISTYVTDVRELFEFFRAQFDENYNDLRRQKETIDGMMKIVQLYQGHTRNVMAKFSILLDFVLIACMVPTLVFAAYGMNMPNHIDQSENGFWVIWVVTITIAIVIFILLQKFFYRMINN